MIQEWGESDNLYFVSYRKFSDRFGIISIPNDRQCGETMDREKLPHMPRMNNAPPQTDPVSPVPPAAAVSPRLQASESVLL